jgi:hypothetical protein
MAALACEAMGFMFEEGQRWGECLPHLGICFYHDVINKDNQFIYIGKK